jgi:hypothetical protein
MALIFSRWTKYSGIFFGVGAAIGLVVATLLAAPAMGQRRGGYVFAAARGGAGGSHVGAIGGRRGAASRVAGRRAGRGAGGYLYGSDLYPYYDPYYGDRGVAEQESQRVVTQTGNGATGGSTGSAAKPAESLVVELRGDHWVRLTGYGASEIGGQLPSSQIVPAVANGGRTTRGSSESSEAAGGKLPAAVLVFRDGHREEISRYTIIGKTIAIKADYWTSGSWTRNVAIADLNVAATLKASQERGAKFSLPSRPGEVVMRP